MDVSVDTIADTFPAIVFVIRAGLYLLGSQALGILLMLIPGILFLVEIKGKESE